MTEPLKITTVSAIGEHTATVIWLHGLGDTGAGWLFLPETIAHLLPNVKWVFPTAPLKPVTANDNQVIPAWFNVSGFDKATHLAKVDGEGMLASVKAVETVIQAEIDQGIPADRIVLGGFSQGCVITLLTAVSTHYKLSGFIGCSGWLALGEKVTEIAKETNKRTPIMICHGEEDEVVRFRYGRSTAKYLAKIGFNTSFHGYPTLGHATEPAELDAIAHFLNQRLSPQPLQSSL